MALLDRGIEVTLEIPSRNNKNVLMPISWLGLKIRPNFSQIGEVKGPRFFGKARKLHTIPLFRNAMIGRVVVHYDWQISSLCAKNV